MPSTGKKVTSVVSRVAALVALAVAFALPLVYWIIAYNDFSNQLEFKAKVKATALSGLIASVPEVWTYSGTVCRGCSCASRSRSIPKRRGSTTIAAFSWREQARRRCAR
jgi:hypothetical protein